MIETIIAYVNHEKTPLRTFIPDCAFIRSPRVTSCCKNCQRCPVLSILQQAPTLEIAKLPETSHDAVKNGSTIWK